MAISSSIKPQISFIGSSSLSSSSSNRKQEIMIHNPFIRGVNIGGWLLLERFINPYFFAITDCHLRGDFIFFPGQIDAPPHASVKHENPHNCTPIQPYPIDEWTLLSHFTNKSIAKAYMDIHYDNFLTRRDVRLMKEAGVTHIRVPLPHWIMEDPKKWTIHSYTKNSSSPTTEPWVDGGWAYFVRFIEWVREEGDMVVWPDIHTAPGSQNGFDNSGRAASDGIPTCHGWDNTTHPLQSLDGEYDDETYIHAHLSKNVIRSLQAVQDVTAAIASHKLTDVVTGFGILNEPFKDCDPKVIKKFNHIAIEIVRANMGNNTSVYIGDMFNASEWNNGYWTSTYVPPTITPPMNPFILHSSDNNNTSLVVDPSMMISYENTFLDSHYYHVFDERPRHLSPKQHIGLVCRHNHYDTVACCYEDERNMTVPSRGISRIIGEWSVSFDTLVCDKLDDVMDSIAKTGVAAEFHRQINSTRQAFLADFAKAQMVVYEAAETGVSRGWFYWTLKMEGGAFAEWDFLRGIREGWIPRIPPPYVPSVNLYGSCYDILFQTKDDMSIINEFPDPSSLDLNNWQSIPISDDVVVTHGQSIGKDQNGQWVVTKPSGNFPSGTVVSGIMIIGLAVVMIALVMGVYCVHFMGENKKKKEGYVEIPHEAAPVDMTV